jgi:hypothetical protein
MNMMKCKIGTALILIVLVFLALITNANAEEKTKEYTISDIIDSYEQGWKASTDIWFDFPTQDKFRGGGIVGENIMIEGSASVSLTKNNQTLHGRIISPREGFIYSFFIEVYKDGVAVDDIMVIPDINGNFSITFTPKEPGYYMIDWTSSYNWMPMSHITLGKDKKYFHVSEKDSDGDGVPDQYDYDPYDPDIQSKNDVKAPAFEAIFAIAGLLAVAYLLRRKR